MHSKAYHLLICMSLIALCPVVAVPTSVYTPSPELVDAWADDWQKRVDKMVGEFVDSIGEQLRLSLDSKSHEQALHEFRNVFYSAVTWEVFSDIIVESMTSQCDSKVLQAITPYVAGQTDPSGIDGELSRNYAICYSNAMRHLEAKATYAILERASEAHTYLSKYESALSNYQEIPFIVTTAAVEQEYGESLDEVISLHNISDPEQQQRAVAALKSRFNNDPAVLFVSLEDPGYPHSVSGQIFLFYQDDQFPSSTYCSGASPPEQRGLIRCSWDGTGDSQKKLINYTRRFEFEGESLKIVIGFDYVGLLKAMQH